MSRIKKKPFLLALAGTSLLILLGACVPPDYNAPAGVDPCSRLTAASVKTAFGLDTHVADGYGRLPAPPAQGPSGCIFTADTQLPGSAYAWTYQLHPLSLDPGHPPAGGMPDPGKAIGTPVSGLGDSAVLRELHMPPPVTLPPRTGESLPSPRVSMPQTSMLLVVWKGSWVYEFKLDYTTDAPGGLSSDQANKGLVEVARASGL
ncbi:hypothetical protein [Arthrobacter sp. MMS18-M83]|uniref:hypothetical protein n=1 Tax=Arthrobacter sp. MMS18-M83 TaxID=2996261 RepID=UPI00227C11C2|nr:hypothetical protein [Arthrobacter sp. MMS18-M83]WAH98237.1 hypothetical protein OW521_05005 [Arthrobacter sp. MMS18-M83]